MPEQYVARDKQTGFEVSITGDFPEHPDDRMRIARTTTLFTKLMSTLLQHDEAQRRIGFRAIETQLELAEALIRQDHAEVQRLVRETLATMGVGEDQLRELTQRLAEAGGLDPRIAEELAKAFGLDPDAIDGDAEAVGDDQLDSSPLDPQIMQQLQDLLDGSDQEADDPLTRLLELKERSDQLLQEQERLDEESDEIDRAMLDLKEQGDRTTEHLSSLTEQYERLDQELNELEQQAETDPSSSERLSELQHQKLLEQNRLTHQMQEGTKVLRSITEQMNGNTQRLNELTWLIKQRTQEVRSLGEQMRGLRRESKEPSDPDANDPDSALNPQMMQQLEDLLAGTEEPISDAESEPESDDEDSSQPTDRS